MSIESTALPSELLVAPQPLIGLCGLDVNRNSVHKSIWDAFSNNRKADRAAVQFKLLPSNYDFPVAKPKRNSYEWYHPKGILKRNWMLKHLHVLPAVVVLFQDMEWNDGNWTEKQMQCAATIQSLKNSLQERNTRICLVLLQKAAPLPPGEDMLASERAASLTSACGLNSKMLFVLPHTEHLMGYALRLESAFLDMAQLYYTQMAKRIRTHRDQLTAAHTTLKIRHQFKLGFVAEMRQDFSTALKHYTQSYTTLDEIRINDTNCLEIKTVAGFLNYKICRLMFKLKVPRDSINHFISHIEKYKNRVGYKDLVFEHYAWLSKQHSVFAELFCEAIKNGLPALQTQHPGIYFHKAAEYIQKRKEAFMQCNIASSPTEPQNNFNSQLNNISSLFTEYFGIISSTSGEPINEQQISFMIRENEKLFNHSAAIINLLSLAMAQFKIYKCLRFRKKLAIDMADEYFKSGDHGKALTLYSLMLPDYRHDKWPSLFSDVLLKTMRCALLSASICDFMSCSLEALSFKIDYTPNERVMVLENLWKVLQCQPPVPQNQNAPEVRSHWEEALASIKSPLQIDLDKLTELIEFCTTFEKFELKNDDIIKLNLVMRLQTDVPLKIRNLQIIITDGSNNYKLQASQYSKLNDLLALREHFNDDSNASQIPLQQFEQNFKLEPTFYYRFLFTTEAQQFLENTQLRVVRIEALIGTEKLSVLLCKSSPFMNKAFRYHSRVRDLDDNIIINPICYITPTFHLVTQCNLGSETMLVNEFYPVTTTINNPYNVFLTGIALNISVPNNLKNKVFLTTDISPNKQKLHSSIQIDIGELSMQSSNTASFYVFSLIETAITLQQKICYTTDVLKPKVTTAIVINDTTTPNSTDESPEAALAAKNITSNQAILTPLPIITPIHLEFLDENSLRKTQDTVLSVRCEAEFKFKGQFYTLNRMPLTKIYRGENFLFRGGIVVETDVEVDILETYFICDHNLVQSTYSFKRKKFTNSYQRGEKLEDVIVLRTNNTSEEWITSKDYERTKNEQQPNIFNRLRTSRRHLMKPTDVTTLNALSSNHMNKSLMGKLPTNMTIINNTASSNALMVSSQNSNMSSSTISDDGKMANVLAANNNNYSNTTDENVALAPKQHLHTRLIYNKTLDAIQATGHLRGFLKASLLMDTTNQNLQPSSSPLPSNQIVFGFYCIKWRRSGCKEENESKFIISGLPIVEPPLNIYCSIEEKMFVKMPMTFKVVLKNPTPKVVHLIAMLSISNTDNFICSGHKQLDISIFAFGEKELVYNLYPLYVGWQSLPELTLSYNTQADPSKDETQNNLLGELVQRSIPKKVFVLPPLKQQIK
ncbi:trafficking protein particle complex subunit 11 [Calliphora vicina]|uniref:trafficking protein particle complex subunit 11 n=2 Tax=Calliphora vicina TaxID=7373 RepID=UPI00325A646C